MSFRLVVWNCNMALHAKYERLLALSPHVALLAGTAFVGSYTTFSTWMLETQRLTEERQHGKAAVNVVLSLAAGVAAAAAGRLIGAHL